MSLRNPMTADSPLEPSLRTQMEQEAAEFMAGEDFDDMSRDAVEFILDDPDLITPILKAAVHHDVYEGPFLLSTLKAMIDQARKKYIAHKIGR